MPSDVEIAPPSPPPPSAKRGPGRPRATPENPQQRIARLQAELHQAEEAFKLEEQKQAAIVGTAALRHARANEDFRRQLVAMLRIEVKAKADLAAIADLLAVPPPAPSSP